VLSYLLFLSIPISFVECSEPPIWKVLLAEAANQSYEGMYAVACVIRNRGGIDGFYGAKRKDLNEFCNRQGERLISLAKTIERRVFEEGAADITSGSTHFENIERFGTPYWAKTMEKTVKIKNHTFWRQR